MDSNFRQIRSTGYAGTGEGLEDGTGLFSALAEQSTAGVFVTADSAFTYVNSELCRIFGYSADELIGGNPASLVAEGDQPVVLKMMNQQRRGPKAVSHSRIQGVCKNGEPVDLELTGVMVDVAGQPGFMGIVTDLSERHRAEAALREREEQLRHAQKLEAVGRLAGGIAHDFNNLLMVIQGSANLILMDPSTKGPQWEQLHEIVRATDRAAALTRQLLAFGRKQVLRPEVIHLNRAVAGLHEMMRRLTGSDIEWQIDTAPNLGSVRVDPGQLEQVVLNLTLNARDAMPDGGRIVVRTFNTNLTARDAKRFSYKVFPGPYVCLSFEDTGRGMPEEILQRVFEPFFTTKDEGKGSGLGLSMVYGIIKQSGGYVWASSTPDKGSRFDIYLPMVDESPKAVEPSPQPDFQLGSGTILLVEDEEPVRLITRRLLEYGGYTVLEASSGAEAARIYDERGDEIDLLLTDMIMPGMGGAELAEMLSSREPSLRVLYMSGFADNRRVRRGIGRGNHPFIEKPFSAELLLKKVAALLSVDVPEA